MESLLAERLEYPELGSNVWTEFAQLANEYNSINLGQGFPSFAPPEHVTKGKAFSVFLWRKRLLGVIVSIRDIHYWQLSIFICFCCTQNAFGGLSEVALEGNSMHQYTRDYGKSSLIETLSAFYSPLFKKKIDPKNEILVTNGAYMALYVICQAIINPGDDVLIIEPFFDCYAPMVRLAGGVPKFVELEVKAGSCDWSLRIWFISKIS